MNLNIAKEPYKIFHATFSVAAHLNCLHFLCQNGKWLCDKTLSEIYIFLLIVLCEYVKLNIWNLYFKYIENFSKDAKTIKLKKRALFLVMQQITTVMIYAFATAVFGIPILSGLERNFMLPVLLFLIGCFAFISSLGGADVIDDFILKLDCVPNNIKSETWDLIKCNLFGFIGGSWSSTLAASMEEHRTWRDYPFTNLIGALLGCVLANIYFLCGVIIRASLEKPAIA